MSAPRTLVAEPWAGYELVDSGGGRKLERYGPHRLIRPEAGAMWPPAHPDWRAEGEFTGGADEDGGGRWTLAPTLPRQWVLARGAARFHAQPTPFRHLAFFPDMAPQWDWVLARTRPDDDALNLFGYTGVASLLLAAAGARVAHVDASRKAIEAARANAALSGLSNAPVRWLVDDARAFAAREVRRGRRYHTILLDPPKYGRGPDGDVWQIERDLAPLVADLARLLAPQPRALVLTCYAIRLSALSLANLLAALLPPGRIEAGDMGVRETARGWVLPTAIYARWSPADGGGTPPPGPVAQG